MQLRHALLGAALSGAAFLALQAGQAAAGQPAGPPPGPVYPAATPKGNYAALNNLPDWGGVWIVAAQRRAAGAPAPEAPAPKGKYKETLETARAYAAAHNGEPLRVVNNCTAPGVPYIMTVGQYPIEWLFTPGRVTMLAEAWTGQRRIYTDGRKHIPPEDAELSFYGDSIGHWEGDTLVVETINMKPSNQIATNVFHSDKMIVRERIHLDPANPDFMVDEITVEDVEALEHPFHQTIRYQRRRDLEPLEFICAENDRNPLTEGGVAGFVQ